jgi:hypothetical protein
MEGQEFLRPSRIFEAGSTSFLLSGGTVGLEGEVTAARRRDDLDVLHSVEHGKGSNGGSRACRCDDVRDIVIRQ